MNPSADMPPGDPSSGARPPSSSGDTAAAAATDAAAHPRTLVWDLPVRVFHWGLALSFAGAWLTAESESWRAVHVLFGYTAALLVAFRLAWFVLGTRYARATALPLGPAALRAYTSGLLRGRPPHYTGHNPAGSWSVVALLGGMAATLLTGALGFFGIGPDVGEVHEALAAATLAVVGVHVIGVIVSSRLHRENLVGAMLTGHQRADGSPPAAGHRVAIGAALAAAVVALWTGLLPAPGLAPGAAWNRDATLATDSRPGRGDAGPRKAGGRTDGHHRHRHDDD